MRPKYHNIICWSPHLFTLAELEAMFSFLFPLPISCFSFLSSHTLIVQEPYIRTLNTEGSLLWPNVIKEKKINKYSINLLIKHKLQFLLCSLHNMGLLEMRTTWLLNLFLTVKNPSLIPIPKLATLTLRGVMILLLPMLCSTVCSIH